jgi:hypothetical protein
MKPLYNILKSEKIETERQRKLGVGEELGEGREERCRRRTSLFFLLVG